MVADRKPVTAGDESISLLLVDFHADTLSMYEEYFLSQGAHVWTTGSGRQALRTARARRPQAICTSYRLHGEMDGAALATALKRDAATRGIPVIIHTSFTTLGHMRRAEASGADAVLIKPLLPHTLHEHVMELVRKVKAG